MRTWQKLSRQSSQDELAPDDDFLLYEPPKKKRTWLSKALEFPQLIPMGFPSSRALNGKCKLKNVLNVYKENISAVSFGYRNCRTINNIWQRYQE